MATDWGTGYWVPYGDPWTYVSGTSFTIEGDHRLDIGKGTKLKWTDSGGVKYGVVASSSFSAGNTTVTMIPTSDYVLASGGPTADTTFFCQGRVPDFPTSFAWSPALTGVASPVVITATWSVVEGICILQLVAGGTSSGTTFGATAPIAAKALVSSIGTGADNVASLLTPATTFITAAFTAGSASIAFGQGPAGTAWTNSGSRWVNVTAAYPI